MTVAAIGTLISRHLRRPLFDSAFHLPMEQNIDVPLVAGAAIFGAGWGMSGLCPGPAIASLALGLPPSYVFVVTMLAGVLIHDHWPLSHWPQKLGLAWKKHLDA